MSESLSHLPDTASASPSSSPAPRPAPGPPPAQGRCLSARAARFRAGPASRVPPLARAWLLGRVPPYSPGRGARAWLLSTCSPLPSSISPPSSLPPCHPPAIPGLARGYPTRLLDPPASPLVLPPPGLTRARHSRPGRTHVDDSGPGPWPLRPSLRTGLGATAATRSTQPGRLCCSSSTIRLV